MDRVASIIVRYRVAALIAVALLTLLAAAGAMRLSFDDQPQRLFEADDVEADRLRVLFESFGTDDRDCLIVVEGENLLAPEVLAFLRRLSMRAGDIDGVRRVRSILDLVTFNGFAPAPVIPDEELTHEQIDRLRLRQRILEHPLGGGQIVSSDGEAMLVIVTLENEVEGVDAIAPVVEALRNAIDETRRDVHLDPGVTARITGIPPLRVDIIRTLRTDQVRFLAIGALLGMAVAWIVFRHLVTVAIVVTAPIIGALWSLGFMGWVGEPVNVINAVMPTLVLVIGFTDAVHLMVDLRRSRATGAERLAAARHAIAHLGPACAMTSLTTCVGFGSLIAARIGTIERFGLVCAAGTLLTFAAVIILVPLTTTLFRSERLVDPQRYAAIDAHRSRRVRYIGPVLDHPRITTALAIVITAALAAAAMQLRPDNRLAETIPQHLEGASALQLVDAKFGGMLQVSVMISSDEGTLALDDVRLHELIAELHEVLDAAPHTSAVMSMHTLLGMLPGGNDPQAMAELAAAIEFLPADLRERLLDREAGRAVVRARVPDAGAIALEQTFDSIDSALREIELRFPDFDLQLTGTTVIAARNVRSMIADLARSLGLASAVIFMVMTIAFRSIRLGVISVIPNVFPLVATATLLVVLGMPLQITSVIVFTVCLGIAVDDTIHFIARYSRERAEGAVGNRLAVERAFIKVAAALVITTAVLLSGFGVVILSEVPAMRLFAALSCFAIAAALVGDLIILPALLMTFGPRANEPRSR